MEKQCAFLLFLLSFVNAISAAPSPADRINECRRVEIKEITDQTREYNSGVVEVRARAGVFSGLSCSRQEEVGSVAFPPPAGFSFESMQFHQGSWENASLENANWSPAGTTGSIRVHGHGCDRTQDAVASGWWTGVIRRTVLPADSEVIWQRCIKQEIPQ